MFAGVFGLVFLGDSDLTLQVRLISLAAILVYLANALFWRWEKIANPLINFIVKIPWIGKKVNTERSLFYTFQKATVKDYCKTLVMRAPIPIGIVFGLYLMIIFFSEHVPLARVMIYMPVIMLVSVIPIINVGGVGALQATVVFFFKDYAAEASLLAVALVWPLGINGLKVIFGAPYLTKYSTKLFQNMNMKAP